MRIYGYSCQIGGNARSARFEVENDFKSPTAKIFLLEFQQVILYASVDVRMFDENEKFTSLS